MAYISVLLYFFTIFLFYYKLVLLNSFKIEIAVIKRLAIC